MDVCNLQRHRAVRGRRLRIWQPFPHGIGGARGAAGANFVRLLAGHGRGRGRGPATASRSRLRRRQRLQKREGLNCEEGQAVKGGFDIRGSNSHSLAHPLEIQNEQRVARESSEAMKL